MGKSQQNTDELGDRKSRKKRRRCHEGSRNIGCNGI